MDFKWSDFRSHCSWQHPIMPRLDKKLKSKQWTSFGWQKPARYLNGQKSRNDLNLIPGLDIDAFAPRLSFFWGVGMNFYMEVIFLINQSFLFLARQCWACSTLNPHTTLLCPPQKVYFEEKVFVIQMFVIQIQLFYSWNQAPKIQQSIVTQVDHSS